MKKLCGFLFAAMLILVAGCWKEYDDSALSGRVDELEGRVTALETLCSQMNTNISSLQAIVNALQNNDYVTSVTAVTENGVAVGYTINFTKSSPVTIFHGKDGEDGYTPIIGVRQDSDGIYYWTLDGEWLRDGSGNRIKAEGHDGKAGSNGKDGITPQLKIQNGYWYVSLDNGISWTNFGKATGENGKDGDSMFRSVAQDDGNVYLTLADGTVITIPKGSPLSIEFDEADLIVMSPNSTHDIHYTVISPLPDIQIEAISSADIKAKVIGASAKEGVVRLTSGAAIDEYSKVVVLVSDGEKVIMKRFTFEETTLTVTDNAQKEIAQAGGVLTLEYMSNMECKAVISEEGRSWITLIETRAVEHHTVSLNVAQNSGIARSATIELHGGNLNFVYTVMQDGYDTTEEMERAALTAFYIATGGENWKNNDNWCSDKPLSEWYGITTDNSGRVTQVSLSSNQLSGYLPPEIGNLTKLYGLYLDSNRLTGNIPSELCTLTNLGYLDFGLNQLSGAIPSGIGNMTNLTGLYLNGNMFSGTIPSAIGNLKKLQYIYLNGNTLSGTLPPETGNLTDLKSFDLRGNQLSGTIPKSVQQASWWRQLWVNIVYGNRFDLSSTTIPAPEFSLRTLDGTLADSSIYAKNKYTVLFQWAYWCGYTKSFTPILVKLYEKYRNHGLDVLGWTTEGTLQDVSNFISSYGIAWQNVYCNKSDNEHYPPLTIYFYPAVNVVDSNGNIIFNCVNDNYNDLESFLYEHLGEGDPEAPYESTDYSQDGKVTTLHKASKGNGIDIILLGDAFSDRQIADGTYMRAMQTMASHIFDEEPYKSFSDLFNVYVVNVVSASEGYDSGSTALSGFFGDGTHVGGNDNVGFQYALKAISRSRLDEALIIIAMNKDAYAGTCYMYYSNSTAGDYGSGPSVAYFPTSSDTDTFAQLLHHEACGHGFAKLADEYSYLAMGTIPLSEVEESKNLQTSRGWWKNVDFTSNPATVLWNYFLNDSRYANDGLGVYEGGMTYWRGVWRPTNNSIMRYNTGGFNAPSREAIYYRIHKLAYGSSWVYNYEDFVKYDEINRKTKANSGHAAYQPDNYKPLHPPVVMNKSWTDGISDN